MWAAIAEHFCLIVEKESMQPERVSSEKILLTGATGVLGANLLKELLATTDADVFCLVRAADAAAAKERLHGFLKVYDPQDKLYGEFQTRVTPVLGDIVHENLGLSADDARELADVVDVVIHGAANTNLFARMPKIEPINVGGTKNIIDFTLKTRQKYMVYVSTYTVMGDKTFDRSVIFKESDLDIGQGFKNMTYQQSKFTAEHLIHAAGKERGLQWKVVRPGQIFGESRTGHYPQGQTNVSGLFYDIFKTIIESGVALYSETHYDVTPVDYVSRAIAHLALKEKRMGETYHLTNPDIRTYTDITNVLRDLGYPIDIVPQEEYRHMLFNKGLLVDGVEYKSYTTKAFRWWYTREGFDFKGSCRTVCDYTRGILEPRGIKCPKIDHDLIGVYIETGIRDNYFPPAPRRQAPAASSFR